MRIGICLNMLSGSPDEGPLLGKLNECPESGYFADCALNDTAQI